MATDILTADTFKGEDALLAVEDLKLHRDLQPREKLEDVERQAANICSALKDDKVPMKEIDRILVIRIPEGTNNKITGHPVMAGDYVCDGHGRVKGFINAGRTQIPAKVRIGTWEDCVSVSTSANIHHKAMPRSSEDKKRAVLLFLTNNPEASDRQVSEHCKVGHDLPKKYRPEAEKLLRLQIGDKAAEEKANPKQRVGKDGKKQAAKKKPGKKAASKGPKLAWKEALDYVGKVTKFIDAAGDIDGNKKNGSFFQRLHTANNAVHKMLVKWKEELDKAASKGA